MAGPDLCAKILELDANMGAFFVEKGHLVHWRMREGLKLPEPEKVGALMFQRTLIHSMLQAREEYVGKMHFNLTSYDQMDIFHFGLDSRGASIMLVTVKKPYDLNTLVPRVMRLLSKHRG
ncbi:MAG: hypothetical protein ACREAY_07775 [Nitrososphaera sp.]|uniref:hypothetical protein n=1 Tax=Nitrososphaera sp. TaxID=1971748 RepID=UPI003D6F8F6A